MQHNFLYEQIAKDISSAINNGDYHLNTRLPSLREVSEMYSVSMATAIQAYQTLENKGLIQSRPKSGYYVTSMINKQVEQPDISQPTVIPTTVTVAQLAMSIVNEARLPRLVKLGAAVPGTDVLPLGQLARSMAGVSRVNGKHQEIMKTHGAMKSYVKKSLTLCVIQVTDAKQMKSLSQMVVLKRSILLYAV